MEKSLKDIYYDPKSIAGFSSIKKLAEESDQSYTIVKKWLTDQRTWTLHKPALKTMKKYRKYRVPFYKYMFQMDLVDMQKYSKQNKGFRYLMTVIDVFTRFAWCEPIRFKTGIEIKAAFERIGVTPMHILVDRGGEFYNAIFKKHINELGIKMYSVYTDKKAAVVERFNKTLKSKLTRYFTYKNTVIWYPVLESFVKVYNNSKHSSLPDGLSPNDARKKQHWQTVWLSNVEKNKSIKNKYTIGQSVRVSRLKTLFEKSYTTNWSETVYKIYEIDKRNSPVMYILKDYNNEIVQGKFYESEIQVITEPTTYPIEKILKRQKNRYLVKFLGYPENYWIDKLESTV